MSWRRHAMRWCIRLAKVAVLAVVVFGIHRTFSAALEQLEANAWRPEDLRFGWLALACALYLLGLVPAGSFWHAMLRAAGQTPGLGDTLRAYFIGHLGKYVPGKAMVVILRAGLIRGANVRTAVAAVTVFFETLSTMAVGAVVAALILAVWFPSEWKIACVAAGLAMVTAAPTLPPVFRRLTEIFGVSRFDPESARRLAEIPIGHMLAGWLALALGWLVSGLGMWATLAAIGVASDRPWSEQLAASTAAAALSTVAGFVALIPGGLLVREAVVLRLLAPVVGDAPALVAAVVSRLISVVAEVAVSSILYGLQWRRPRVASHKPLEHPH